MSCHITGRQYTGAAHVIDVDIDYENEELVRCSLNLDERLGEVKVSTDLLSNVHALLVAACLCWADESVLLGGS